MGRLIDADKFRRYAHEQLEGNKTYTIDEILEMIDEQPTAYDVEKVVAELEYELELTREAQTIECRNNDGYGTPLQAKFSGEIGALLKAIEIVRKGGVE